MSLLTSAFKLALRAKMLKDGYKVIQEVIPASVQKELAKKSEDISGKLQESAADLLAKHAPAFSKKIAKRADPAALEQQATLQSLDAQMKELARSMQKAQGGATTKPAAKRKAARKTTTV